MKRIALLFIFALSASAALQAQANWSFKGTVIKMRMTTCAMHGGFMATMSGAPAPAGITCPEYTMMSDKVVYVVVGRRSEEFIPLAENMVFLVRKNELVLFSDDEKTKSRFTIQQMILRADWERDEARKDATARMAERSVNYELRNPPRTPILSTNAR